MNKLVKVVEPDRLVSEYISVLNGILNLTNKQCLFLEMLIKYEQELRAIPKSAKNVKNATEFANVLSCKRRKAINETLNLTQSNISLYKKIFLDKGILYVGDTVDSLRVNEILLPTIVKDRIQLSIILKQQDDTTSGREHSRQKTKGEYGFINK